MEKLKQRLIHPGQRAFPQVKPPMASILKWKEAKEKQKHQKTTEKKTKARDTKIPSHY